MLLGAFILVSEVRGVAVTEAARVLYTQARRVLSQTDSMARQFRRGVQASTLEIGVEADIAGKAVAAFVRLARQAGQGICLNLLDGCRGGCSTGDRRRSLRG